MRGVRNPLPFLSARLVCRAVLIKQLAFNFLKQWYAAAQVPLLFPVTRTRNIGHISRRAQFSWEGKQRHKKSEPAVCAAGKGIFVCLGTPSATGAESLVRRENEFCYFNIQIYIAAVRRAQVSAEQIHLVIW